MRPIPVLLAILLLYLSPAWAETVRFGVFPFDDPADVEAALSPLADYLARSTGDEIEIVVARDYQELADRLREGSLDLAWLSTLNYLRLTDEVAHVGHLVACVAKDSLSGDAADCYRSLLIATRASAITTLEGARGKRLAFTDPASTSGCLYARLLLRREGIDERSHFRKVFYLGRHDRVIEALLAGAVDVGAVAATAYRQARLERGDLFVILAASEPIPLPPIVVAPHFPEQRRALYREVLTDLSPDDPALAGLQQSLHWPVVGFESRDDAFYDSAREALSLAD